jgi:hypothetical protein
LYVGAYTQSADADARKVVDVLLMVQVEQQALEQA